jgi:hypothetical protein
MSPKPNGCAKHIPQMVAIDLNATTTHKTIADNGIVNLAERIQP